MTTELLMQGADAYTSLAEVATTPEIDAIPATVTLTTITVGTVSIVSATIYAGC